MASAPSILLIGWGKMGSAMLQGCMTTFPTLSVTVVEPHQTPSDTRIKHLTHISDLADDFTADIVLLAVKPQVADTVCVALAAKLQAGIPILSIIAGKTLGYYADIFGSDRPVIRAMPNTPAAIGLGMTVVCASQISSEQKALADMLLRAVGKVEWIEDESLMDAVTAVSGSGPAYVFLLIEELAKAGAAAGLPSDLAMTLARQTVIGSAQLAEAEPLIPAETLRQNVTSPGGTTEAALNVLMGDSGLGPVMTGAIQAATERSKALAAASSKQI